MNEKQINQQELTEVIVKKENIYQVMVDNAERDGCICILIDGTIEHVDLDWISVYKQQHPVISYIGFCPKDAGYYQNKDENGEYPENEQFIEADAWAWFDRELEEYLISYAKENGYCIMFE